MKKEIYCPLLSSNGEGRYEKCMGSECGWYVDFAGSCGVVVLAEIFLRFKEFEERKERRKYVS